MARKLEILTTLLIITLGIAGYLEAQKITGFSFDPLGSQAFPIGISLLLIGVCALVLMIPVFKRQKPSTSEVHFPATAYLKVLAMLVLVTSYVITVFIMRLPLSLMTVVFVVLASTALPSDHRLRDSVVALATGLVLGFGIEWIFTHFFFVDLPTLW